MTLEQAKRRAAAIAGACRDAIAVVHCGCDEYTCKRATLALDAYPQDIVFIAKPRKG